MWEMGSEFRQDYGQLQRTERSEMPVGSQHSSQSCFAKATNGFVSGTVLGATMSGLTGMARATQLQIRSACSLLLAKQSGISKAAEFPFLCCEGLGFRVFLFDQTSTLSFKIQHVTCMKFICIT